MFKQSLQQANCFLTWKIRIMSSFYRLEHSVELDDTDGYFVIGGGTFINGMEGYFGPLVYYRNRISPQSMVMQMYGLKRQKLSYCEEMYTFYVKYCILSYK